MVINKEVYGSIILFLVSIAMYAQGTICANTNAFCADNSGQFNFSNSTNSGSAEAGPNYGCLTTQPNPAWFYIKIGATGNLNMQIEQNSLADFTGTGIDVDFICYGPFTQAEIQGGTSCNNLTNVNTVDCSYSPNAIETLNITNAIAGQYYMLLITNFDNSPGFINMELLATSTGGTDCSIVSGNLGADQDLCLGELPTLDGTTIGATSYTWEVDTTPYNLTEDFTAVTGVATDPTYTITNNLTGIYRVTVSDGTASDFDDVLIVFHDIPTANPISNLFICDDNNDGSINYDLTTLYPQILLTQSTADFEINYFEGMADYTAGIQIPDYTNYINSNQTNTIIAEIRNISNNSCLAITTFEIQVFDGALPSMTVPDLSFCDNTSVGSDNDGIITFNLEDRKLAILNTQNDADFTLTFFTDAAFTNPIATADVTNYTNDPSLNNANGEQTIYVKMTSNLNASCTSNTSFKIIVFPLPTITPIVELKQCDDDIDGITLFNLTEANILISDNSTNEFFTYYLTQAEAEAGLVANQITNPTNYSNPTALSSFVYSRIETANGCYRTARINLIVGATQIPTSFQLNYSVCDDYLIDNDNRNGVAAFNFSDASAQLIALFPAGQNITLTYYRSLLDALAETNPILDISNHRNDTSPNVQAIFVRVDNEDVNACLGLGQHITLTVDPLPDLNTITDYPECSDTISATFDLSSKDAEVIGAQTTPILISYHDNILDAESNASPITSPYLSTVASKTIYVRAQFDTNNNGITDPEECFTTDMRFNLIINLNPEVFAPTPIRICSQMVTNEYDVTIRANEITGGDNTISLTYFETQADLVANNAIPDPTEYISTVLNNTIEVLATGANGCTSQVTLMLNTNLFDNFETNPMPLEVCDIDTDGFDSFDLTLAESDILNGLPAANYSFDYYQDEADAILGNAMQIITPTNFNNTAATTQIVYARVQPITNACFQVVPVTLVVHPFVEIGLHEKYLICLAADDSVLVPVEDDTAIQTAPIDTNLSDTEFIFQWYEGQDVVPANAIIGATESIYNATTIGFYTVFVTNILSQCTYIDTTEVVSSYPPESISVEVLTDAFSENSMFEVTVTGIGTYEFSLYEGYWQSSPIFTNVLGGEHMVKVRDVYNCEELSYDVVIVDYPKVFTPNNDGFNDTWNILGTKNQLGAKIYIFDRYGKLMKQLSPSSIGWDGTFKGDEMPTSDYWFTVEYLEPLNNTKKEFKAHFTLKR